MVYIVTGPKDSGKTEFLIKLSQILENPEGFVEIKVFDNKGKRIGYDLYDIKTGKRQPLCRIKGMVKGKVIKDTELGEFIFLKSGFKEAEKIVERALKVGAEAFFIDEVGQLELEDRGFFRALKKILKANKFDIYIGCRENFVASLVQKFKIQEYRIIKVREESKNDRPYSKQRAT